MSETRELIERRREPNGFVEVDRTTRSYDTETVMLAEARPGQGVVVRVGPQVLGQASIMRPYTFLVTPDEARAFAGMLVRLAEESESVIPDPDPSPVA